MTHNQVQFMLGKNELKLKEKQIDQENYREMRRIKDEEHAMRVNEKANAAGSAIGTALGVAAVIVSVIALFA